MTDDDQSAIQKLERKLDEVSDRLEKLLEREDHAPTEADTPPTDVAEDDGEFLVTLDLPGFDREDVDLRMTDSNLHVTAERSTASREDRGDYLRRERHRQKMTRTIGLPAEIDEEAVSASFENGILTVSLPKKHREEDVHRVPIS